MTKAHENRLTHQFTLRANESDYLTIRKLANDRDVTMGVLLREIISNWIKRQK